MIQHDTSGPDANRAGTNRAGTNRAGTNRAGTNQAVTERTARDDATTAISALLDRWADGIRRRDLEHIAAQFTPDALFQGFDPEPSFGRDAVSAYYGKQPVGLTAEHTLIRTSALGDDAALGYAAVRFDRPGGPVNVYLTIVAVREEGRWLISHYHVSRVQ